MKNAIGVFGMAVVLAAPQSLSAQATLNRVSAPVIYESYSLDLVGDEVGFDKVSELAVPVGIDIGLGRIGTFTVSTGYVMIDLRGTSIGDQSVSGLLDTQVRFGVNVVPGRLIAFASGTIPTGIKTLSSQDELAILGALSSDIIGFAAPTIGTGGSIGGGFAGAVPVGRFAFGIGGNYKLPLAYVPVVGDTKLRQGGEIRVRAGLEGPLARQTYIRVAAVFATRGQDERGSQTQNGVGNRLIGYLALSQGVGGTQLNMYAFDVYRGTPTTEETVGGVGLLPKGNLLAFGSRWMIPLGSRMSVTPRVEYRVSTAAAILNDPSTADPEFGPLERQGNSIRFGFDLRQAFSDRFAVVLVGSGLTGTLVTPTRDVGISGYRLGLHLRLTP